MRALLLIPLNFLILNIRVWLTRNIFHISKKNKSTQFKRIVLLIGMFVAFSIFVYPSLVHYFWYDTWNYLDIANYPNIWVIWSMCGYILIIFLFNNLLIRSFPNKLWLKEFILLIILLWWGYFLLNTWHILPMIIYYFIVASSEEGLKYLSSTQLYKKQHFMASDLILYALLVALGFAFFENIVYMLQSANIASSLTQQLANGTWILLSRGLIGFLVHMLFTGSIAALSISAIQKWNRILILFGALFIGILLHMSYNILLHYHVTWIIIFYLIAWYFFLTRIFRKNKGIYIEK